LADDIHKKVDRIDRAARLERRQSPEMIQKTKAVRFPSGVLCLAKCQEDAPSDNKISVKLLDAEGEEAGDAFDVTCNIAQGGVALDSTTTRLRTGDPVIVGQIYDTWYCIGIPYMPSVYHT